MRRTNPSRTRPRRGPGATRSTRSQMPAPAARAPREPAQDLLDMLAAISQFEPRRPAGGSIE